MENFVVSARKYRPATFGTVVGQPTIVQTLKNAISSNTLAQAFLFTGPRGIGKTTCARILAKTINCLNLLSDTEPCNECSSCVSFNQLASFNIQELDAASNNSVDDIRTLIDQVRIPPQAGRYKVYIIDEVHMLSQQAFNAFLKTLEEPPAYAKFILATTERHKILPTILSRCQIYDFKRITVSDIAAHLAWVATQEGIICDDEALHVIALKADGAMRDALSIFDQIVSFSGRHITYSHVISNLNLLDYEYYFRVMDGAAGHNIPGVLLVLDEVLDKGFDGLHFVSGLAEHLRSLLLCKDPAVSKLLEVSEGVRTRYTAQSALFGLAWLVQGLDIVTRADLHYRNVTNKRLHIELMLMQLCELRRIEFEKKKGDETPSPLPPAPPVAPSRPTETPAPQQPTPSVAPSRPTETPAPQQPAPPVAPSRPDVSSVAEQLGSVIPSDPPRADRTPYEPISTLPDTPVSESGTTKTAGSPGIITGNRLSIKSLMEDVDSDPVEEDADETSAPEVGKYPPLDAGMVQALVVKYAGDIATTSASFSTALMAGPVEVTSENAIVITFANRVAADPEHLQAVRNFLKQHITHTWFRVEALVDEVLQPAKRILSPREKLARMAADDPGIADFITKLGLEPEE
jgi:DNA polymerase III subunit gamma/tau